MDQSPDELFLNTLISQVEQNKLEFKAAASNYDTEKAISYCAALANEGGGHFVLGVNDNREVTGSDAIRNPAELELRIYEKLQIKVVIKEIDYQGKRVVIFQIPPRRRATPIGHDGRFFMRAGESLVPMSAHQIAAILAETEGSPASQIVTSNLSLSETLALLEVNTFFDLMPDTKPATSPEQMEVLVRRGLLTVGDVDETYSITVLGALFLARTLEDFPTLKLRRIRFIKYAGNDRVTAVFEHFENRGYAVAFENFLELVASHTPVREHIAGGLRTTTPVFPPTAIREFLANALIHQDLNEDSVQLTVEIFADRLEIRNPGEPLIDVERFVDETRSRNPDLAELMRLARICEVRGSGVDRAVQQIEDYMQPAPKFGKETAATTITMFDHMEFGDMTVEERVWSAFLHCCIRYESSDRLTNASLRTRFGLGSDKSTLVSQTISAAIDDGWIKLDPRVGSSKRHAKYVPFFA